MPLPVTSIQEDGSVYSPTSIPNVSTSRSNSLGTRQAEVWGVYGNKTESQILSMYFFPFQHMERREMTCHQVFSDKGTHHKHETVKVITWGAEVPDEP